MTKVLFILIILILSLGKSFGQRNIINVPTSEIVDKKHVFFQEQIVISNRFIKSSTLFTVGLGKKMEAGITIYQLSFNTRPGTNIVPIAPEKPGRNLHLLINAQKGFELAKWLKLGLGTRSGINVARTVENVGFATFSYLNSQFSVPNTDNQFIAGTYFANYAFSGKTNVGLMLGTQVVVIKEKLTLIGDFISGTSSISNINLGFQISLPHKWQIAFAAQLPSPGSNNNHGGVVQIVRK